MEKEFEKILKDCEEKFNSKKEKYGDSWKTMSLERLWAKLEEELEELEHTGTSKESYNEIIDVINCALMFAFRLNYGDEE